MEKILNTNDGWEQIVNAKERQERIKEFHDRRRKAKVEKLTFKAALFGLSAAITGCLGSYGLLVVWLSAPVTVVLAGACCFLMGRVFEMEK